MSRQYYSTQISYAKWIISMDISISPYIYGDGDFTLWHFCLQKTSHISPSGTCYCQEGVGNAKLLGCAPGMNYGRARGINQKVSVLSLTSLPPSNLTFFPSSELFQCKSSLFQREREGGGGWKPSLLSPIVTDVLKIRGGKIRKINQVAFTEKEIKFYRSLWNSILISIKVF